eukprot:gene28986-32175_t
MSSGTQAARSPVPRNLVHCPPISCAHTMAMCMSHLSLAAQPSITAKLGIFSVIDNPRDELLLIIGVSRKSTEVDSTLESKINALPQYQLHNLGCSASVEPSLPSCDDPVWLLCAGEDGCRPSPRSSRPSPRSCQSESVIPLSGSDALSPIDYTLISGAVPEHHRDNAILPRQSSHLTKAERRLSAPLSLLPYTTTVAKGGAHAECVHQEVQPLPIVESRLISTEMEMTPISEKVESVPKVHLCVHNPSPRSAVYLDRAHMRLEFIPMAQKIESVPKGQLYAYDNSLDQSDVYLDRAYMRLSTIRAQASSQQYRGSTTWYDTMLRSQQMSRRTDSGLPPDSGADCQGPPSSSTAAGSARRRHEHSCSCSQSVFVPQSRAGSKPGHIC